MALHLTTLDLEQSSTLALVNESEKLTDSRLVSETDLMDFRGKRRRKLRSRNRTKLGVRRNLSIDPGCKALNLSIALEERKSELTPVFSSSELCKIPTFLRQVAGKRNELVDFALKEKLRCPGAHCIYIPREVRQITTNLAQEWTAAQAQIRLARTQAQRTPLLPPLRVGVYRQQRR